MNTFVTLLKTLVGLSTFGLWLAAGYAFMLLNSAEHSPRSGALEVFGYSFIGACALTITLVVAAGLLNLSYKIGDALIGARR